MTYPKNNKPRREHPYGAYFFAYFYDKTYGWKKVLLYSLESLSSMAEGVGFEPTIRYNRIPDFESGAFDLSATLPRQERI